MCLRAQSDGKPRTREISQFLSCCTSVESFRKRYRAVHYEHLVGMTWSSRHYSVEFPLIWRAMGWKGLRSRDPVHLRLASHTNIWFEKLCGCFMLGHHQKVHNSRPNTVRGPFLRWGHARVLAWICRGLSTQPDDKCTFPSIYGQSTMSLSWLFVLDLTMWSLNLGE